MLEGIQELFWKCVKSNFLLGIWKAIYVFSRLEFDTTFEETQFFSSRKTKVHQAIAKLCNEKKNLFLHGFA